MNTISNERLEKLSEYDCADRYEVMSMATELLALRKEREKVVNGGCEKCGGNGSVEIDHGEMGIEHMQCPNCVAKPVAETDTTSQQFESLGCKAVSGWTTCSERMPDFYYSCLVADEHGDMVIGLPSNLEVSDRKAFCLSNGDLFLATHWQPLPEPPCK
ncbi:DUF551 domain-containing protein [Cronobacter sakazakii]|uniref:DUF551 domain-containing protein n=1 Tax=Cronobacter sakazakii TaxID=28141 RepID=UPI000977FBC6|nr:DUF551 domain-containing protein [Cronobacter sakazakii]KAB1480535.1 DUF551 domain-containing protein [Cronobacter sakazakii]